jgi:hypothetical protein
MAIDATILLLIVNPTLETPRFVRQDYPHARSGSFT